MDTSDPAITFDDAGVCNHCRQFETVQRPRWLSGPEGEMRLNEIVTQIRKRNAHTEYDCVLGLSGGVDSSYLAIKAKDLGLRPLVVHVDAGWNSELAVQNIERLVKALGFDLHTIVIDWEEIRDLQTAFLRAGVPNQDIPQDHAFFAALYRFAVKHRVHWVLSGANLASESILPAAWGFNAMDSRHLRAIHRQFGTRPLGTFPLVGFWDTYFFFPYVHRMRVLKPLDYLPYDKRAAKQLLIAQYGWRDYGAKHYESTWTKFFQGYYLPTRFGYDKRLAHLSSLIVAGQLTRDDALAEMQRERYPAEELRRDRTFVLKKLGLSETEFEQFLHAPIIPHERYPSNQRLQARLRALTQFLGIKSWLERNLRG
jgi:N-acetyl sugar amidotransferase